MGWEEEKLENARQIRTLLGDLCVKPRKRWGQNFLIDTNVQQRIVRAVGDKPLPLVWEVGPGLGALTRHLIPRSQRLSIFEIDPTLTLYLSLRLSQPQKIEHVQLVKGDVCRSWRQQWQREGTPTLLVANLPYNIAGPLLVQFARQGFSPERMLVMVQKELADRLTAPPSSPLYNALSLCCQLQFTCLPLFRVTGSCFFPNTRVISQVLLLTPRRHSLSAEQQRLFFTLVRTAFVQRRKTLFNNLKNTALNTMLPHFQQLGVHLHQRPEELTLAQYCQVVEWAQPADSSGKGGEVGSPAHS